MVQLGADTVTYDPDLAVLYGTTREEYKLWVDYIFDWFKATLERRFRRYLVAAGWATLIWLIGLLVLTPFGLAWLYITSPAVYFFWIGIAWCMNALRWLSQTYHIRTNRVRPCFPIGDSAYKDLVSPYARKATANWSIALHALPYAVVTWAYIAAVLFSLGGRLGPVLEFAFPRSFPLEWRTGADLIPKMVVLDFLFTVSLFHAYTGARLTLATTPLYAKLATIKVVPLPIMVTELFQGVLNLYLSGAFMWSFGIVLAELLYLAQLDLYSIYFVVAVTVLGLVAFLVPRNAVKTIWEHAKHNAIDIAIQKYYAQGTTAPPPSVVEELNRYIQAIDRSRDPGLDKGQILNLVAGQALPLIPLLLNTFVVKGG